jgi:hypothetical protein
MRSTRFAFALLVLTRLAQADGPRVVLDANDAEGIGSARVYGGASLSQVKVGGANRIRFLTPANAAYPRFDLIPSGSNLNWSGYATLSFTASSARTNDKSALKLYLADTSNHSQIFASLIPPGTTVPQAAIFNLQDSNEFGIYHGVGDMGHPRGSPNTRLDLAHIAVAYFYFSQTDRSNTYDFDGFYLEPNPGGLSPADFAYKGFVDRFGQNNRLSWPGKATSLADLASRNSTPECLTIEGVNQCLPLKASSGFSQYGGIKSKRLTSNPTGFFEVKKEENGRWWFVDPEGYAFYMVGMNGVYVGSAATFAEVPPSPVSALSGSSNDAIRKSIFSWLPAPSDPAYSPMFSSMCYDRKNPCTKEPTFNFYRSNLYTRYGGDKGSDYMEQWRQRTRERLTAWGFNTVGNSSELPFWGNYVSANPAVPQTRFPYTPRITISGTYQTLSAWGGALPDVFDPQYPLAVAASLSYGLMKIKYLKDPWLIGYLIDNELPWGFDDKSASRTNFITKNLVPILVLGAPATSFAKQVLLSQLKNSYGTISAFNSIWGTQFSSFDAMWPGPLNRDQLDRLSKSTNLSRIQSDMDQFTRHFVETYYRTIRWQLLKIDPDHLYLCSKFASTRFTPLIVSIAAKYCDVVSFDIYQPTVDDSPGEKFEFLESLDKPVMIAEFNSYGLEGGFYGGVGNVVSTQSQRATEYSNYASSVYRNRAFVGWEWFKYMDDPLTGRDLPAPSENMNAGFVDITDSPYPALVQKSADVNRGIYRLIENVDRCSANKLAVYRANNKNAGLHLFTTDHGEFATSIKRGLALENYGGDDAVFFVEKNSENGALPIRRLYNPGNGQHYLTINDAERDILLGLGWKFEKNEGFLYADAATDRKELFHLYNGADHIYTVRATERDALIDLGWKLQNKDARGNGAFGFVSARCN